MREVVILGVGMTHFGKHPEMGLKDLGRAACWEAIKDAGISPKDVEYGVVANAIGGVTTGQTMVVGQVVLREVGIVGIPIINVEDACASGTLAAREAYNAIKDGHCDMAIACGVEKMFTGDNLATTTAVAGAGDVELDLANGVNFPTQWALRANKRMEVIGTTVEEYALVSYKSHKYGALNPRAQYQKKMTLEQILGGKMIAEPMNQFMCSGISDGAAAIILCEKKKAKKFTSKFISFAGFGIVTSLCSEQRDATFNDCEQRCGQMLYENSGIGPKDISFAEVHDCFAIAEFMRVEGLGLYEYGEYGHALKTGECELGGRLPINPSGGLLSKGHPIAASGVAQICEAVWQLRGVCKERQVPNARVALTHCAGGGLGGDNAVSIASILKKDYR